MQSLVYVVWRPFGLGAGEFRQQLMASAVPRLLESAAAAVRVNVADIDATFGLPVLYREGTLTALVCAQVETPDQRVEIEEALQPIASKLAGYAVEEDVAKARERRTWTDGERTPGAKLVTLFRKAAQLSHAEFLRHWTEVHTPLALEVHPQWSFVRHVVLEGLSDDAPAYDGIVEEQCRQLEDITDAGRYFGAPKNIKRILESARKFLDMSGVESHIMSEYVLRD
jgi:hypothetical protein